MHHPFVRTLDRDLKINFVKCMELIMELVARPNACRRSYALVDWRRRIHTFVDVAGASTSTYRMLTCVHSLDTCLAAQKGLAVLCQFNTTNLKYAQFARNEKCSASGRISATHRNSDINRTSYLAPPIMGCHRVALRSLAFAATERIAVRRSCCTQRRPHISRFAWKIHFRCSECACATEIA